MTLLNSDKMILKNTKNVFTISAGCAIMYVVKSGDSRKTHLHK